MYLATPSRPRTGETKEGAPPQGGIQYVVQYLLYPFLKTPLEPEGRQERSEPTRRRDSAGRERAREEEKVVH